MPLYEYQCDECAARFERIHQKFSDPPIATCPSCGGSVKRLPSSPAIQFKGSGWYITDYAKKGGAGKESGESGKSEPAAGAATGTDASADKGSSSSSDSTSTGDTAASKKSAAAKGD